MNNEQYKKIFTIIILSLIFLLGAYVGAYEQNKEWQNDIHKSINISSFSDIAPTYLTMEYNGNYEYYLITKIDNPKYYNNDTFLYNDAIINKTIKH